MYKEILLLIAVFAPLSIYLRAAFRAERTNDYRVFLNPTGRISSAAFANTATAYSFQVASISFFFYLGFTAPATALLNAVLWGFGIFVFWLLIKRNPSFLGSDQSLMAYLDSRYNAKYFRLVSGVAIFISFLGLLLAELVIGTNILVALGVSEFTKLLIAALFSVFVVVYYRRGGHVSVINTDQQQLLLALIGFFAVLVWSVSVSLFQQNARFDITITTIVLLISIALLLYLIYREIRPLTFSLIRTETSTVLIACILLLSGLFLSTITALNTPTIFSSHIDTRIFSFNIEEFGTVAYISAFVITPLFWHLGDATHWHRLGAIRTTSSEGRAQEYTNVRNGLFTYAVQSPLTIVLTAALGALAQYAFTDIGVADAFTVVSYIPHTLLNMGSIVTVLVGVLFCAGIIGIMLSTVDSFLATNVFVAIYDIVPSTRRKIDLEKKTRSSERASEQEFDNTIIDLARFLALGTIIVGIGLYVLGVIFVEDPFSILFFCFSVPLAIAPVALTGLLMKEDSCRLIGSWASGATILGVIAGVIVFSLSVAEPAYSYWPPLFSFVVSSLVLLFGIVHKLGRKS